MGQSKQKIISEDNFFEWLASTGYLFPSNPLELARFEKLYADFAYRLTEDSVDPFAILNGEFKPKRININLNNTTKNENFRIAARNFENIPEHIIIKLKRNQNGTNSEKERGSEEKD